MIFDYTIEYRSSQELHLSVCSTVDIMLQDDMLSEALL